MIENMERNASLPCPFREGAKCSSKCANQPFLFSTYERASFYESEKRVSGEKVTEEEVQEFVEEAIREGVYKNRLRAADCVPTFPDAQ